MQRIFLLLVFLLPFQARLFKFLRELSLSWIDPGWNLPAYFEVHADLFVSDFLVALLCIGGLKIWEGESKFLTLFLGAALVSIVASEWGGYALGYWRWGHLVVAAVVFFGMTNWAPMLRRVATVVMISGLLECSIALPQYFSQHHLGLKFAGEQTLVSRHVTPAHFLMPREALTVIDYGMKNEPKTTQVIRAYGTLPHPNVLGGFLVFTIVMTLYLYELGEKKRWLFAAIVVQMVTLFATYSRGAIFALAGVALFYVLSKARWHILAGFCTSVLLFFPQLFYRGGVVSAPSTGPAIHSDLMRVSMQNVALQMIREHPWLGVGFNNYMIYLPQYIDGKEVDSMHVHNIYLLIAAETGVVGLSLFLAFCLAVAYRGWKARHTLEGRTLLLLFVGLLAIGWIDYYPMAVQQIRLILFMTAGLLFVLHTDPAREGRAVVGAG